MNRDEMKKQLDTALDTLNGIYITLECFQADDEELLAMENAMNAIYDVKESL